MRMITLSGNSMRKLLLLAALGFFLTGSSVAQSQPLSHVVQKGDTLWGISAKYYGDSELWPKLWEMNPFITNPHLLKPGDTIQLMEKPSAKPAPPVKEASGPVQVAGESKPKPSGIYLPGMTIPIAAGYLSRQDPQPLAHVFATDSDKTLLGKGDALFLDFGETQGIKAGDLFFLSRRSALLEHPLDRKNLGYIVSPRSKVRIRERARENIFRAEIMEYYAESSFQDLVFPFSPAVTCLNPLPVEKEVRGIIAAVERELEIAGKFSIVYLDCGADKGLKPGHLLEIVKIKNIPDPDAPVFFTEEWLLDQFKAKTIPELFERLSRESALYELPIGQMIVLDVKADTSTALILMAEEHIPKGFFFRGIPGTDRPEFLSSLPACETK